MKLLHSKRRTEMNKFEKRQFKMSMMKYLFGNKETKEQIRIEWETMFAHLVKSTAK